MEVWDTYIERFNSERDKAIRADCHPRFSLGSAGREAIVLIHGLTDSPFFLDGIGAHFAKMGFDVYLPLLHGHGLQIPNGMADVSLDMWKTNVDHAIAAASEGGRRVSIGGLSTGGALAIYEASARPGRIDGGVFLFSAALDLATEWGDVRERLLRQPVARLVDAVQDMLSPLVGENPYRYSRMDYGGAAQLSRLIEELDRMTHEELGGGGLSQPVFAAHSSVDATADIQGVKDLLLRCPNHRLYELSADRNVGHASLVLQDDICSISGKILEHRNPYFGEMMNEMELFAREALALSAGDSPANAEPA